MEPNQQTRTPKATITASPTVTVTLTPTRTVVLILDKYSYETLKAPTGFTCWRLIPINVP